MTGSMRENLDPEGNASDTELWRALEQSRLKEHVESMVSILSCLPFPCVTHNLTNDLGGRT